MKIFKHLVKHLNIFNIQMKKIKLFKKIINPNNIICKNDYAITSISYFCDKNNVFFNKNFDNNKNNLMKMDDIAKKYYQSNPIKYYPVKIKNYPIKIKIYKNDPITLLIKRGYHNNQFVNINHNNKFNDVNQNNHNKFNDVNQNNQFNGFDNYQCGQGCIVFMTLFVTFILLSICVALFGRYGGFVFVFLCIIITCILTWSL